MALGRTSIKFGLVNAWPRAIIPADLLHHDYLYARPNNDAVKEKQTLKCQKKNLVVFVIWLSGARRHWNPALLVRDSSRNKSCWRVRALFVPLTPDLSRQIFDANKLGEGFWDVEIFYKFSMHTRMNPCTDTYTHLSIFLDTYQSLYQEINQLIYVYIYLYTCRHIHIYNI